MEVPGLGWLDYDPNANWGEASPTLWVTTVITKGSALGTKDSSAVQHGGKEILFLPSLEQWFLPEQFEMSLRPLVQRLQRKAS